MGLQGPDRSGRLLRGLQQKKITKPGFMANVERALAKHRPQIPRGPDSLRLTVIEVVFKRANLRFDFDSSYQLATSQYEEVPLLRGVEEPWEFYLLFTENLNISGP